MYSLLLLGLTASLASFLLTPLVRNLFIRWGFVDQLGERKIHRRPVPRVGGVAIALAYVGAYAVLFLIGSKGGGIIWAARSSIWQFLPAAAVIFATGLWDDLVGLKPWQKLAGQIVAAGLAYWAGVHVHGFGGHEIADWWSIPATILWLLLCTNAVNLIDGVDGLAAGIGLFAATTTLLAALLQGNIELALATAPLVGALLGFIRFNFNPASIFLGDSGSLFIGFLLGCFGVLWSQKSATLLGMTAPLMALAIPLLDTVLSIVRRFLRQKPIFSGDRGHIHHRLLDRGFSPRKVALLLYGCCALGAVASLAMMNQNLSGFVIVLFCAVTWMGVQHLGYVEFGLVGRMFFHGAFRRQLNAQLALQSVEDSLGAATTVDECWMAIIHAAGQFGFNNVVMYFAGNSFEHECGLAFSPSWTIRVPVSEHDYIELTRSFDVQDHATAVAPFADLLRRALSSKLTHFAAEERGLHATVASD